MPRTALTDLLRIDHPIIQAGMGAFTSARLAAAVSNAGGLGSLGAGGRGLEDFRGQLALLRDLTDRPFAVNHTLPRLDEVAFALTLAARPTVVSFALGDPGDLVQRAHEAGALVMHQVTTAEQALRSAEIGVDVIVAQGGEAGGFGGTTSTVVLVPQVVDAVGPLPVVAAGGIADGRGLAAALALGAAGANVGTRFLASTEAPISETWKQDIVRAQAEDARKAEVWNDIFPPMPGAYATSPRTLRSRFLDEWIGRREEARRDAARLGEEIGAAVAAGNLGDLFPFAGQSAGLVADILPAAEIVHRLVQEATLILERGPYGLHS